MEEVEEEAAEELPLESAGHMLCRIRQEQGLTLAEIAEKSRIPLRHLEVIEAGDFAQLPGRTYAIGFSKTYARILGLDENEVARQVRGELADTEVEIAESRMVFEPGDPAKIPSPALTWVSAIAALIFLIGAGVFIAKYTGIGVGPDPIEGDAADAAIAAADLGEEAPPPPPSPTGTVAFTALEDGIWVRFYNAGGRRLMEKQMAIGESYQIPAEAVNPQIWTGRPDAFSITIDGQPIPKLAEEERVIRDVPVSAQALLARDDQAGGRAGN